MTRVVALLALRFLGERLVLWDGAALRTSLPPRAYLLLAMLVMRRGPVARATLAAALWPEDAPDTARTNLRRHLHRLATALPEGVAWFDAQTQSVAWNHAAPFTCDVLEFERACAQAGTRADGIACYRGEFLPENYEDWVVRERERLQSLYVQACLNDAHDARVRRDFDLAARRIDAVLAVDPWREDALRFKMTVRYEAGDRAGALALFDAFEEMLRAEMGVTVMAETRSLRDAIYNNVVGGMGQRSDATAVTRSALPLVGRVSELAELRAAWQRAARGAGSTAFVFGDAGIGKTRLVSELAAECEREGAIVLRATANRERSAGYGAIVEVLRQCAAALVEADMEFLWLSVLSPLVPEIRSYVPDLPPVPELADDAARQRVLEALCVAFDALSRMRPAVIIFEDLHAAHSDELEALAALARRAGVVPLLLVATYRRDGSAGEDLVSLQRRTLVREGRAIAVPLRALASDDVERLVGGLPNMHASLFGRLNEFCSGNPLLALQFARSIAESGEGADVAVPDTFMDAIRVRMSALRDAPRAIAEVAAIAGGEVSCELLSAVTGWNEGDVIDAIAVLTSRAILRETGAGRSDFTFTHALIAGAIYDACDVQTRRMRHRRFARALQQHDHHAPLARIAWHWEHCGEAERAARAYADAAAQTWQAYARGATIEYAHHALKLTNDDRTRFDAALLAAKALHDYGAAEQIGAAMAVLRDSAKARGPRAEFEALELCASWGVPANDRQRYGTDVERMLALAQLFDDDAMLARALDARANYSESLGDVADAFLMYKRAMSAASASTDLTLLRRIRGHAITCGSRAGQFDEVRAMLDEQADELAAHPSIEAELAHYGALAAVYVMLNDGPACEHVGKISLELAQKTGSLRREAIAHTLLAHAAHAHRFDPPAMRRHYDQAMHILERVNDLVTLDSTYINRGYFERETGHIEDALRWYERTTAPPATSPATTLAINLADAALERDDAARALEQSTLALQWATRGGETRLVAEATFFKGVALVLLGRIDDGIAELQRALEVTRTSRAPFIDDSLSALVRFLHRFGHHEEALQYERELEAELSAAAGLRNVAYAHAVLAQAAAVRSDERGAQRHALLAKQAYERKLHGLVEERDRSAFRSLRASRLIESVIERSTIAAQ